MQEVKACELLTSKGLVFISVKHINANIHYSMAKLQNWYIHNTHSVASSSGFVGQPNLSRINSLENPHFITSDGK